jgi:hypothetical protein
MRITVTAVSCSGMHTFSNPNAASILLIAGIGVDGDVHSGEKMKASSRAKANSFVPNLRQVHLMHAEFHDELNAMGFCVSAGQMGENITTRGLDLLSLPRGARLHIGKSAIVEVTGLRKPCSQINTFQAGLLKACLGKDEQGQVLFKPGVMGTVVAGGDVKAGDEIMVELPAKPHCHLEEV